MKNISSWFLRLAVLYLLAGVGFGIYLASTKDFSLRPLHVHLNLLGWVTMALFGLFYRNWPAAGETKLAKVHFWLFVPSHLVQMITLFIFLKGNESIEPVLALSSVLVGMAVICFAIIVWKHTETV